MTQILGTCDICGAHLPAGELLSRPAPDGRRVFCASRVQCVSRVRTGRNP